MGYAAYIKISRIDKNGVNQTNTLQSLNQITIPYSTGDIVYEILEITEHPTYFLYYINPAGIEIGDRAEIKYDFTGSILNSSTTYQTTQDMTGAPDLYIKFPIISSSNDNLNFLNLGPSTNFDNNNSLNTYRLLTYPQETIQVDFSGSIMFEPFATGYAASSEVALVLLKKNGTEPELLQSSPYSIPSSKQSFTLSKTAPITSSFHISASLSSSLQPGDSLFAALGAFPTAGTEQITASFTTDTIFTISSSNATGLQVGLIAEPYFGESDFLRALDCQPLLNNANINRIHNLYQDVDYSAGATEPVNFDLLINGSATRAEVQLSNYTTQRHIIPRYKGSKSTSQKLNTWSRGDIGTFGKTPTIESLKTVVAYCDFIGGWPPERMNASTAHVLYLIDVDGNVSIPNTSENSLANVQGAFQTGERFKISSETLGTGVATPFRTVIRGGQRIEPILYRQSGSAPNAHFNTTMSFEDIIPSVGGATADYLATAAPPLQGTGGISNTFQRLEYNYITLGTAISSNQYNVSSNLVGDGVSLTVQYQRTFESNDTNGLGAFGVGFRIVQERSGGDKIYYPNESGDVIDLLGLEDNEGSNLKTINISSINLQTNDKIYVEFNEIRSGGGKTLSFPNGKGWFKVTQDPMPTSDVTASSSVNSLWNWGNPSTYPNIITSSNATFVQLYDTTAKQTDINGSGFNTIALPFSIKVGDEFRFEGREDYAFMVKNVYAPYELGNRVFPTGSIEVHFDRNLPTAVTGDIFNLDNFLIRRYVDDASSVLMEGFKPENSAGPFIITPEYVAPKMNQKVDEYITLLTEKGLL